MKESTRLLHKYGLAKEWLEPEIRADFSVETWRKKLWLVELDLALELKNVCQTQGLSFFLVGGSMIGAVRHQGFIPWDDDMDIAMTAGITRNSWLIRNGSKSLIFCRQRKRIPAIFTAMPSFGTVIPLLIRLPLLISP